MEHLSYSEFNNIFEADSLTAWVKYNWLGEAPYGFHKIDLGDLNWYPQGSGQYDRASSRLTLRAEVVDNATPFTGTCDYFIIDTADNTYLHRQTPSISIHGAGVDGGYGLYVYDATLTGKTAEETKAFMKGKILIYKIVTPL